MKRHLDRPGVKFLPQTRLLLASVVLASLATIHGARATDAPTALIDVDPAFLPGLARLKRATGLIEDGPNRQSVEWKPNLQLLVGVKAMEGSKCTINFVELTTLPPPTQPWQPALRTNDWAWSPNNKTQFVIALYPVRVRVFDEMGRQLKGGQTPMAWGMLTNGLMDLCRVSFESYGGTTNSPLAASDRKKLAGRSDDGIKPGLPKPHQNDELMRATGGGFLWMFGMFQDLQTVPTVADVWAKAQCAIRWPSAWTIVTAPFRGITLELLPRFHDVTLVGGGTSHNAGPLYRLPVDLLSGKRNLARVDIVVGPAHGAEMLLAGIRSIRAVHPTKPKHEFLAQVLAAGQAAKKSSALEGPGISARPIKQDL